MTTNVIKRTPRQKALLATDPRTVIALERAGLMFVEYGHVAEEINHYRRKLWDIKQALETATQMCADDAYAQLGLNLIRVEVEEAINDN